jgi:uncharacterized protein (DUF433 family)
MIDDIVEIGDANGEPVMTLKKGTRPNVGAVVKLVRSGYSTEEIAFIYGVKIEKIESYWRKRGEFPLDT